MLYDHTEIVFDCLNVLLHPVVDCRSDLLYFSVETNEDRLCLFDNSPILLENLLILRSGLLEILKHSPALHNRFRLPPQNIVCISS